MKKTTKTKATTERVVLITNLLDVVVDTDFGKLLVNANALVLFDRGDDESGPRYRVHGFRNEAANLLFDMVLPSFDWTVEQQSRNKRAFVLCVAGRRPVRLTLHTDFTNDAPLDVQQCDVTDANRGAWAATLVRKVLRYYHAPYFIVGQQVEADKARQVLGVESVEGGA